MMNLEERMKKYREETQVRPREQEILDTIRKSQERFYEKEQERMLAYWEFLWAQLHLIQKRWWMLQILVLILAGLTLPSMQEEFFIQRGLGVAGALFVILIIPELWKNQSARCMEIEAASYYSLRQIYAARILLFGLADTLILTVFCAVLHGGLQFAVIDIMAQFLFPMAVTACICFGLLCSQRTVSKMVSMVLCITWSGVWWLITINEKLYEMATLPVWMILLGIAVLFLAGAVYKILKDCNGCWEVSLNGIKNN